MYSSLFWLLCFVLFLCVYLSFCLFAFIIHFSVFIILFVCIFLLRFCVIIIIIIIFAFTRRFWQFNYYFVCLVLFLVYLYLLFSLCFYCFTLRFCSVFIILFVYFLHLVSVNFWTTVSKKRRTSRRVTCKRDNSQFLHYILISPDVRGVPFG